MDDLPSLRHELCTSISHILGYSELLEEVVVDGGPIDLEDLHKIQQAARQMLTMVGTRLQSTSLMEQQPLLSGDTGSLDGNRLRFDDHSVGTAAVEPISSRPGRILAVDDNLENLNILSQRLSRQGHVVSTAADGLEALQMLRQRTFDLVLLDVMMPRLDGYGTLRQLKSDQRINHIPVIMISALSELASVVRCIEAGAEDYLPKPFNSTLLHARVHACLEKKFSHDQQSKLYEQLVNSQQQLDRVLIAAHRDVAALDPEVRSNAQVQPLLMAFETMADAVSKRETDLRATIQDLEITINHSQVSRQVRSIVDDPNFFDLSLRAKAMRARRERGTSVNNVDQ